MTSPILSFPFYQIKLFFAHNHLKPTQLLGFLSSLGVQYFYAPLWVSPPLEGDNASNSLRVPLILQANVRLIVFLYWARNTNAGLRAPLIRTYERIQRRMYPR